MLIIFIEHSRVSIKTLRIVLFAVRQLRLRVFLHTGQQPGRQQNLGMQFRVRVSVFRTAQVRTNRQQLAAN